MRRLSRLRINPEFGIKGAKSIPQGLKHDNSPLPPYGREGERSTAVNSVTEHSSDVSECLREFSLSQIEALRAQNPKPFGIERKD